MDGKVHTSICVTGIGNELRGDDAAGLLAARRLRELLPPEVTVIEADGELNALMDIFTSFKCVFLIDAVKGGSPPGTILRADAVQSPIPAGTLRCSSHVIGIGEAVEMARALGRLPAQLIIYGVESTRFELGSPPQGAVIEATKAVAESILMEIRAMSVPSPEPLSCTNTL